ncbi:alanyl-tRNA editing protein [Algihabitans albus]|uniref:alanyl-tRNA editing protein n=1 Tax=Algihabitans albus TaxID=2164067 RepID=UPI000E5D05C6|nr:alanyl-tRNA editing protein [Algihabitans albus]
MRYFCQDNPTVLALETEVIEQRGTKILLAESPFYPGGGGQLADLGRLRWSDGEVAIAGFQERAGRLWLDLVKAVPLPRRVEALVDPEFRSKQAQLHSDLHIVNALVFRQFDGALVTGAQMNADGTARVDFDIPGADSAALRALEPEINAIIRQDLPIRSERIPADRARREVGLLRSLSVDPPVDPDGSLRVIEIAGLDRQACGGTHLSSTGHSAPVRIVKIDNKGRKNRRIRIALLPDDAESA